MQYGMFGMYKQYGSLYVDVMNMRLMWLICSSEIHLCWRISRTEISERLINEAVVFC